MVFEYIFLKVLSVDISFIIVRSILTKLCLIFYFMIFNLGLFFKNCKKYDMIFKIYFLKSSLCTYKFHECQVNMNKVMANFWFYNFELCYLFENCESVKTHIRWYSNYVFLIVVYVHISFMTVGLIWTKLWAIFDFKILNFVICLQIVAMSKQTLDDIQNIYF